MYGYFADWRDEGVFSQLNINLVRLTRTDVGREDGPTLAVLDSQSVKTSTSVPTSDQGVDPNKAIVGRKRHIAVDILGLLLALLVTGANVSDTYGGRKLLDAVHAAYPTVRTALVDGGYQDSLVKYGATLGITVIKVKRNPEVKGFVVIPKRWIVERTLCNRLAHVPPPAGPRFREPPRQLLGHDPHRDDRQHAPPPHHQNTPNWCDPINLELAA